MSATFQNQRSDNQANDVWESDFLTPEQRLQAVAELLAAVALRAVKKKQHDDQSL